MSNEAFKLADARHAHSHAQNRFAKGTDGVWLACVKGLQPGRYRYKLVVDGERWTDDASNGLKEPDEFGGFNSILNVV